MEDKKAHIVIECERIKYAFRIKQSFNTKIDWEWN